VTVTIVTQDIRYALRSLGKNPGFAAMELSRPLFARALGTGFAGSPGLDAAVVGMLVAAGSIASWAPARRAAHLDPLGALRTD
jgi:hypothetical protein